LAAGNFEDIYSGNEEKGVWAGVVTCFFIDCVRLAALDFCSSSSRPTFLLILPSPSIGFQTGSSRLIAGEERPAISTNHL